MVSKFNPELNKVYLVEQYSLFHILEGKGVFHVDFKPYLNWKNKIIFLERGQYIKFLSEGFVVRKIEFPDDIDYNNKDVRVLFKHLLALGYINFEECSDCQKFLSSTIFSSEARDIIDVSSKQWFWQNPFQANKDEYHIIFDIKEIIDERFKNNLSNDDLVKLIKVRGYDVQSLLKNKVGISIKSLFQEKRVLESKKEVAFSNKSIKEIAYDLGYKDSAYFTRVFKRKVGISPTNFRADFDFQERDTFLSDLYGLLHENHIENKSLEFYAENMHLTVKTLSKKVKDRLNITIGQLIRIEIINSAKSFLDADLKIKEIARQLGFEEANHFSSYFKFYTGETPSSYKKKKYK